MNPLSINVNSNNNEANKKLSEDEVRTKIEHLYKEIKSYNMMEDNNNTTTSSNAIKFIDDNNPSYEK